MRETNKLLEIKKEAELLIAEIELEIEQVGSLLSKVDGGDECSVKMKVLKGRVNGLSKYLGKIVFVSSMAIGKLKKRADNKSAIIRRKGYAKAKRD